MKGVPGSEVAHLSAIGTQTYRDWERDVWYGNRDPFGDSDDLFCKSVLVQFNFVTDI